MKNSDLYMHYYKCVKCAGEYNLMRLGVVDENCLDCGTPNAPYESVKLNQDHTPAERGLMD